MTAGKLQYYNSKIKSHSSIPVIKGVFVVTVENITVANFAVAGTHGEINYCDSARVTCHRALDFSVSEVQ